MKREIKQCMSGMAAGEDGLSARFVFPEGFIGFQGHFPAKKILPGVCQIQCVLSLLEEHSRRPVALKEVALVKFFTPVLPQEEIACVCRDIQGGAGDFVIRAQISRGGQKVSEMKLKVCYAE